jgi:hypothetical protein
MAGLTKYFLDTPYKQIDGNIVYASHLNNPLAAIAAGLETMSTDIQTGSSRTAIDTGEVNAYVVSVDPAPSEYTEGLEIWLKTATSNTGASTINVNSLGVVDIRRYGMDPLLSGDIPANYFTLLKYSSGFFQIVSASGRGEAEASAEVATAQATIATAQATIATAQAVIATAAAAEASIGYSAAQGDISDLETLVGGGVLGVGQTWQYMHTTTGLRASGVTYTNDTSKPIIVNVQYTGTGLISLYINVDDLQVQRFTSITDNTSATVSAVVPVGSTYKIGNTGGTLYIWIELR